MEKAPTRKLGILGLGPITSTKQPCDVGPDTSAEFFVNTLHMRMLGMG